LRAHKWNAAKALEGMKATEAWRSEFDVDGIVLKKWQTLRVQSDSGKVYCKGTDRDGHPLIFMHPVRENLWDHHGDLINLVATLERASAFARPASCGADFGSALDARAHALRALAQSAKWDRASRSGACALISSATHRATRLLFALRAPRWRFSWFAASRRLASRAPLTRAVRVCDALSTTTPSGCIAPTA
jgi:hypothetical protein